MYYPTNYLKNCSLASGLLLTKRINFKVALVALLSLLLGVTQAVQAQSLEDYLLDAAKNNPSLQAAYAKYQATEEQVNQVSLSNPKIQTGVFLRPMERFMGKQSTESQLMQEFPWFGMLRTQKEEAYQMAQVEYYLFLEEKNQLLLQVRSTWQELMLLQGQEQLTRANLDYLKKYESLALMQFSVGSSQTTTPSLILPLAKGTKTASALNSQMSQMGGSSGNSSSSSTMSAVIPSISMNSSASGMGTVLQIRLQVKELESRLAQFQSNSELLRIQFNQLLNRPAASAIALPVTWDIPQLTLDKQEYLEKILETHPMLAMYTSEKLAFDQQAKMAKLEGKPMLGAGVNYMTFSPRLENGMPMGGENMVMPMVSLSLPIYRKKIGSKIKQVEFLQVATALKQQQTENSLELAWATAFRDWEDSNRQLNLFSEQVDLIQQQIQLLETSFSSGGVSLQELLQTQQQLLEYREKQLIAQYQGHQSLSRLEALFSTNALN